MPYECNLFTCQVSLGQLSTASFKMTTIDFPPFKDLPLDKNGPRGNAWGRWGPDDQLGTLNLLTDDIVASAAKENIITGQRISLKYVTGLNQHHWLFAELSGFEAGL